MTAGIVIVHPEWGIFLGVGLGLAFWSELDSVGQDRAPVMSTEENAREFVGIWDQFPDEHRSALIYHPVDAVEIWATIEELDAAGLSQWTMPLKANRMGEAVGSLQ